MPNPSYAPGPWADRVMARDHWPSAKNLPDALLDQLLAAADEAVRAFAPVLPAADLVPNGYVLATVYQAKEIRDAGQRDGDTIGAGDFVIRARPLTSTVKQLLRPMDPFGGVG